MLMAARRHAAVQLNGKGSGFRFTGLSLRRNLVSRGVQDVRKGPRGHLLNKIS